MSHYELTLVLKEAAAKDEKAAKALVPGKINQFKNLGVRQLAYKIKGADRGGYFSLEIELEPNEVSGLEKALGQNEQVLRHLLISL